MLNHFHENMIFADFPKNLSRKMTLVILIKMILISKQCRRICAENRIFNEWNLLRCFPIVVISAKISLYQKCHTAIFKLPRTTFSWPGKTQLNSVLEIF